MQKLLLLAVAAVGIAATPTVASAKHHGNHDRYSNNHHRYAANRCVKSHHGRCTEYRTAGYRNYGQYRSAMAHRYNADRRSAYRVGYRFGPSYAYTPYGSIPQSYVSRYDLNPDYRYVYRDNYLYQVNPRTYAIERILSAIIR